MEEYDGVDGSGKSNDSRKTPLRVNGRFVSRKNGGNSSDDPNGSSRNNRIDRGTIGENRGTESGGDSSGAENGGTENGSGSRESSGAGTRTGSRESRPGTGPGTGFFRNGKPKKTVNVSTRSRIPTLENTPFSELESDEVTRAKKTVSGSKLVNGKPGDLMLENITALTITGFQLVASQRGSHWNVDVDEAESIARPLTNILLSLPGQSAKQAQKLMNTVAAPLALFGAASGIIVGRIKTDAQVQIRVDTEVAAQLIARGVNNGIPTPQTQNNFRPETPEAGTGQSAASIDENAARNETGIAAIFGISDPVSTGGR